jgi:hypothetical protein
MKKLNKLQINSDRLMNNEELLTLKGGSALKCLYYGIECFSGWIATCEDAHTGCDIACKELWTDSTCSG